MLWQYTNQNGMERRADLGEGHICKNRNRGGQVHCYLKKMQGLNKTEADNRCLPTGLETFPSFQSQPANQYQGLKFMSKKMSVQIHSIRIHNETLLSFDTPVYRSDLWNVCWVFCWFFGTVAKPSSCSTRKLSWASFTDNGHANGDRDNAAVAGGAADDDCRRQGFHSSQFWVVPFLFYWFLFQKKAAQM